jgi:fermentation-respiration switch protein FrsA (DUF1100 family)
VNRSPVKRFLIRWAAILLGLYLVVVVAAMSFETTLVFRGAGSIWRDNPTERLREVSLTSPEGNAMTCRWLPPPRPESPVFVYFNGNGGNVCWCDSLAGQLHDTIGAGVLLVDYPGYGKSEGTPSEAGCYANATAAIEWLGREHGIPPSRIVPMGLSLGGGVAVEMATRYPVRAVVLVNTYTSLPAAAKSRFPFLPTHTLMRNRFDSVSKIGRVPAPVFIAHGTDDRTIPYRQGETLFHAANEPKRFLRMDGQGHNDCLNESLFRELADFLAKH